MNLTPKRIQRKRTPGWRKPANTVIIDRTSRWGNPFKVEDAIYYNWADDQAEARTFVVEAFKEWLDGDAWEDVRPDLRRRILRELPTLRGKDLACTCPVDFLPCHGDVLIERANAGVTA